MHFIYFLVDVWSVGCIFAELLRKEPFLTGRNSNFFFINEKQKINTLFLNNSF